MDKQEIEQGNLLIALFMGAVEMSSSSTPKGEKTIHSIAVPTGNKNGNMFSDSIRDYLYGLKYYTSWDALMPVVEKISKTVYEEGVESDWLSAVPVYDTAYTRTFGMINPETKKVMVRINRHQLFEADTLIEATYMAVVDFVKHNSQPKK